MSDETRFLRIKQLIEELESADAFERREAIEMLALLTQARHGFDWRGAPEDRATAVRRWRKWMTRELAKRKAERVQAALQKLAAGEASDETIGELFGLEGASKEAIVAHVAAQMAGQAAPSAKAGPRKKPVRAQHPVCEICERRPATVRITRKTESGAWIHREACEVCWRSI
jgi:hypothetical protein